MLGASWGPHGELIYFSNFPILTHYMVKHASRHDRTQRHAQHMDDVFEHEPHEEEHGSVSETSCRCMWHGCMFLLHVDPADVMCAVMPCSTLSSPHIG